ncbi:MAG: hypothetical protein GPJ52_01725 [Candidatus Heimdallarchaeota archaeon]|nr:hypothetical protein [Candidatus Heimdallarchaeota archaeon]
MSDLEIPGIILLLDDEKNPNKDEIIEPMAVDKEIKSSSKINSELNFKPYDLLNSLIENGYNVILTEPDVITMQPKISFIRDISLLVTDLSFQDSGEPPSYIDFQRIGNVINRILENRNRLLVIIMSGFLTDDEENNNSYINDIKSEISEKHLDKITFVGCIKKTDFEPEKIDKKEIFKTFMNLINEHMKKIDIENHLLMFHWECLVRNSIEDTIGELYPTDDNSMNLLFENISRMVIDKQGESEINEIKSLYFSTRINEIICSILNSKIKSKIEYSGDKKFTNLVNLKINNIKKINKEFKEKCDNYKSLNEVKKNDLVSYLNSSGEKFINKKQFDLAYLYFKKSLEIKNSKNQVALKNKKQLEILLDFWQKRFLSLINFRFFKIDDLQSSTAIFSGLILKRKVAKKDNSLLRSILVITPRCDIPLKKTYYMTCLEVYLNIKPHSILKSELKKKEDIESYYKDILNKIDIKTQRIKDKIKIRLEKNKQLGMDRFYLLDYVNTRTNEQFKGIIDFSRITHYLVDDLTSGDFQPFMIIEDYLLSEIRVNYTKYINRMGILDFTKYD